MAIKTPLPSGCGQNVGAATYFTQFRNAINGIKLAETEKARIQVYLLGSNGLPRWR
ncbi:hypothetical protein [Coleofasciculus sp. FACHB-1120]|uniref:hypothetical protein n=1 Tax=Coleofasciculus sp. FACHB-1120 TaxID=2692783 RepID=UPI001688AD85|nr:hypothetical protein [Coleofasciculus sp. FACHB-1120]MBD2740224.1 hypothetical protein [Coleofasciculus sp. FACHB-1120]